MALIGLGLALTIVTLRVGVGPTESETIAFTMDIGVGPPQGYLEAPALSYDGRSIAFVARNESGREMLWVRRLDSTSARSIAGTDGAHRPFWSPDGRFVAFFASGQLKKIAVTGGPAVVLGEAEEGVGGAWGQDGEIIFSPLYRGPLYRISAMGGPATAITTLNADRSENSHRWPQFLPDGRHFLFTARSALPENTTLSVGSLDSKEIKYLFSVQSSVRFAPTGRASIGYLLFVDNGTLVARRFDVATEEVVGEPTGVAESVVHNRASVFADFSVSGNGEVLLYRQGSGLSQLVWFDREGRRLQSLGVPRDQIGPRISPDGKRIAVSSPDPFSGNRDIWVLDAASGISQRLTNDPANDWQAVWSPDSNRIAFTSDRKPGVGNLYIRPASSVSTEDLLLGNGSNPSDWSGDGRFVAFEGGPDDRSARALCLSEDKLSRSRSSFFS
jgi:Tol biopolymer transport system component